MNAGDRIFAAVSESIAGLKEAIGAVRSDLCTYQSAAEIYHREVVALLCEIREELRKQNVGTSPASSGTVAGLFSKFTSPGEPKLRIIPVSFSKRKALDRELSQSSTRSLHMVPEEAKGPDLRLISRPPEE